MVVTHGDAGLIEARQKCLVQSDQCFVLPQCTLGFRVDVARLGPVFQGVVAVRVGEVAGGSGTAARPAIEGEPELLPLAEEVAAGETAALSTTPIFFRVSKFIMTSSGTWLLLRYV